jgi:hypothetical protein
MSDDDIIGCDTCAYTSAEITIAACPHGRSRCVECIEERPCRYCISDHDGRRI